MTRVITTLPAVRRFGLRRFAAGDAGEEVPSRG
jgi:hypothetical protein